MTQTSITPAGFETAIPASDRPQTLKVGGAATAIGDPLFPSHYHQPTPGSVVGIATGYGLDGPGIEFL